MSGFVTLVASDVRVGAGLAAVGEYAEEVSHGSRNI
jgi:hypothetical protein